MTQNAKEPAPPSYMEPENPNRANQTAFAIRISGLEGMRSLDHNAIGHDRQVVAWKMLAVDGVAQGLLLHWRRERKDVDAAVEVGDADCRLHDHDTTDV